MSMVATHIPAKVNKGSDLLSRWKETEFLNTFPQMDGRSVDILYGLPPMYGLIQWKDVQK